jgi:hypothetical protein
MMNKSDFVKTCSMLFTASLVVGAFSYSSERFQPKKVDFSAFKNASQNIQYISQKTAIQKDVITTDVTAGIVKTIESEVRRKILRSRYTMAPKNIEKRIEIKTPVIAKNWNDIKPEYAAVDLRIDNLKLNAFVNNTEAAEFEINNNELIKLYKFEVESKSFETYSNVAIASVEEVNDEVNVAQASTKMNVVEEITPAETVVATPEVSSAPIEPTKEEIEASNIATTENAINDDLLVFDYSDSAAAKSSAVVNTQKVKKIFDAPISDSVKQAIEREVHKSSPNLADAPVVATSTRKAALLNKDSADLDLDKVMTDEDSTVFDYSKNTLSAVAKKTDASPAAAFSAFTAPDLTTQVEFTIKAQEINMSTQKVHQSFGFEFVPDYDRAERMDDQTSGEIKLGYSLSGDVNTQTGVVQSQGMIPTRVELHLLNEGINVPFINEVSIQKFLQKKGLDIVGNLLMTAIDPSITDVEIDSEYQAKVFFSDKFKIVATQDAAAYVMFLGVKNGNVLLRYLLDNKESAQKIVYVGEGEMYFEDPDFVGTQRELYTFTTRTLLGRKVKELNIDGSEISFFGTKITSKKKTLNSYEIKVPELVENTRKYLEFKHLGNSLFVGTSGTKEIEIPGNDFIGRVLQANELSELGERCMVQINLKKDLRDMKVSGKNRSGEMFAETSFLDNDGNFSRDSSELAEKVFVTGDLEGIFNVRLDYTDGTVDFLKTFCSEGSYLVEQL